MPQKKNPSTLELIRGKTGEVYGSLMQLLIMVKGVPSGYYQDLQETKPALWRCFDTVKTCLEVMAGIVSTLKVKEERMLKVTEGSLTVAVDLAEKLVVEKGLSFREAYALVAALVKYTLQKSIRLRDLDPSDIDDISVNVLGRRVQVNEAFIEEGTDPMSSLLARRSAGGPQPREVGGMLLERERQLHTLRAVLDSRRSKIIVSRKLLSSTVEGYLV
jgi:argininosuccinate lyase